MSVQVKAPPVYKPTTPRVAAPPVYRPSQSANIGVQLKPADNFRIETRPAPPAYRPQQAGFSTTQQKPQAASVQPQSQYELSPPVWVGNGRQQIRVKVKGAPTPIGSVDVHYDQPGKAFISDLEVNQAHRRYGVGTMLMKAAMDSARRNGRSATELEARPGPGSISNQALVGMYQKMGFRNAGFTQRGNPRMQSGSAQVLKVATQPLQRKTISSSALFGSSHPGGFVSFRCGSTVIQRSVATYSSSGSDSGGDKGGEPPKKEPPSPFTILDRARGRWDAVTQFIEDNRQRVQNVLNSPVANYNNNWLMGATLYQLLNGMLQQLDHLWNAYQDEHDQGSDDMFDVETESGALTPAARVLEEEHQGNDAYFQQIRTLLFQLVSFFEEYQTTFAQNNYHNHVPQNLFDAAPAVHLDQGGTTVQQSMALENLQLNLIILDAFGKQIPHPGGDRSGKRH